MSLKHKINGKVDATILVESGIPALLADSAYVFNSGILSEMTLTPTGGKEKINLTSYIGEVFVLSNYDYGQYELAVPVMYLHNDLDEGSRIVNLDLGNQRLQKLDRALLRAKKKAFSKLKMNTDTYMGMWAIEASMSLDDGIKTRTLSGNFLIDFGNPELFFLIYQTEAVQQFLADNTDMDIHDIKNPHGEVVLQAIFTKQC